MASFIAYNCLIVRIGALVGMFNSQLLLFSFTPFSNLINLHLHYTYRVVLCKFLHIYMLDNLGIKKGTRRPLSITVNAVTRDYAP